MSQTVLAAAVTTVGTIVVALVGLVAELLRRQSKQIGEQNKQLGEVRDQVQNSHKTNLRDDLDQVIASLSRVLEGQERHDGTLRRHGREIAGIREEIRHERVERLGVERRVDQLYAPTR